MSELRKQNRAFFPHKMGILVLAAGYSQRFAGDKRCAKFRDGCSLLELTIRNLLQCGLPMRVCLRDEPGDRNRPEWVPDPVIPIYCTQSRDGMGATLAQGIAACEEWSVTLVALGDMPLVSVDTVLRLMRAGREDRIVAPTYRGQRGHPVAFGRRFYRALRSLSGDEGARAILKGESDQLLLQPVDDSGVLLDVDTPEALERLKG